MEGLAVAGIAAAALLAVGCGGTTIPEATSAPGAVSTAATAATPVPVSAPVHELACTAMQLAGQDEWAASETHWISAEAAASPDLQTTVAFLQLGEDAANVALDQDLKKSSSTLANDIATYHTDLASYRVYVAGC